MTSLDAQSLRLNRDTISWQSSPISTAYQCQRFNGIFKGLRVYNAIMFLQKIQPFETAQVVERLFFA